MLDNEAQLEAGRTRGREGKLEARYWAIALSSLRNLNQQVDAGPSPAFVAIRSYVHVQGIDQNAALAGEHLEQPVAIGGHKLRPSAT